MLAKFMLIAASKIRRSQRNTKPLRNLATAADEGFEPVKLEPEDSHVGASVTGFVSATVRSQLKFFYVFRLSNGVLRHGTVSQCTALTKAWKGLVDEYVAWHVSEANSTPIAFLEQGVIGDSSDQGQEDFFLDSADEDDNAEDFQRLSEVELLRKTLQLCKVLEVKLGTNRPPPLFGVRFNSYSFWTP